MTNSTSITTARRPATLAAISALSAPATAIAEPSDLRTESARAHSPERPARVLAWDDLRTDAARETLPRVAQTSLVAGSAAPPESQWDDVATGAAGGALAVLLIAGGTVVITRPKRGATLPGAKR
jgi:hypothetical protein